MASRRNAKHVAAGRACFQTAPLHQADLGGARFDKIFAIHVGVFLRGQPARELQIVRDHLAPGGSFSLIYEPLVAAEAAKTAETACAVLTSHGFTIRAALVHGLTATRATCVIAAAGQP